MNEFAIEKPIDYRGARSPGLFGADAGYEQIGVNDRAWWHVRAPREQPDRRFNSTALR